MKLHMLPRQHLAIFSAIVFLTGIIYWQGLSNSLLFDDIGVLMDLGRYAYLGTSRDLGLYLLAGDTGPTGRPLSLISFFLNDSSWPIESPQSFQITNIIIHLLNGGLIFWSTIKLLNITGLQNKSTLWFGVLLSGFWLVHPFQITSVLYIVQRMNELATFFALGGITAYLYGRQTVINNASIFNYGKLTVNILFMGLLSLLSKENGILMFGYILVLEFFLLRPLKIKTTPSLNLWLTLIIALPFLAALSYILISGLRDGAYTSRPFTLEERLLSEGRILIDYLVNILLPGFSTPTLFHDDYEISKNWLAPWTTLASLFTLGCLFAIGLKTRKQHPVISFSIFWFFCGHLLESTVVALELYFEHRNYLPMLGPLTAVAYGIFKFLEKFPQQKKLALTGTMLYSSLMVSSLLLNTTLWSKPVEQIIGWAQEHPDSVRAVEALETLELAQGYSIQNPQLLSILNNLRTKQALASSYVVFRDLKYNCANNKLESAALERAVTDVPTLLFDNASANALYQFTQDWISDSCPNVSAQSMVKYLEAIGQAKQLQYGQLPHYVQYGLAVVWEHERNLGMNMQHLQQAYQLMPQVDGLLIQAVNLSSAGLYSEARAILKDTSLLEKTWRERMILALRYPDIDRTQKLITEQEKHEYGENNNDNTQHHIASQK